MTLMNIAILAGTLVLNLIVTVVTIMIAVNRFATQVKVEIAVLQEQVRGVVSKRDTEQHGLQMEVVKLRERQHEFAQQLLHLALGLKRREDPT